MALPYKTRTGRIIMRRKNGRFRKATGKDLGIGICPNTGCNHLTIQVFDKPGGFPRQRCFTCEPEKEQPKVAHEKSLFVEMIEDAAADITPQIAESDQERQNEMKDEITKLHIEMDEALGNMESHGFGLSDVASRTRKRYTGLIKKLEEEIAREEKIIAGKID